jgi:hypothetical protein
MIVVVKELYMICEKCLWWQDWDDRVFANISTGHSNIARNQIELRRCRFIPHPSAPWNYDVYTDSDYKCSEFKELIDDNTPSR